MDNVKLNKRINVNIVSFQGDSDDRNVTNPLSKHFLNKVEEGILTSYSGSNANRVLLINMNCSYWKNSMDRIG